jgi:putative oligomerization/nucleic acid binding protein
MTAARILAGLGLLLALLSLLAGYIRFQALDTDTVKGTAEELIADDQIRDQVAATLVDALYANIDVAAALEQKLPADQKGLAGPAAAGLREFSDRAATRMLERPRVQALWVNTVTQAHRQLLRVLEDDTGALSTENGAVVLNLQPLVIQLGNRVAIVGNVAEQLGPDAGRVEIMQADQLETAQDLTRILKFLGMWLWLLPIALWAAALWIARDNRRSILRMIAVGSILIGLIVLVLRRVGGSYIVDSLVPSVSVQPAAHDAWDIVTSQLRDGGFTFVGLGVILLVALWLAGPSPSGVSVRTWLAPYLARPEIAFSAAGVLFLLLLWWSPTVQTTRVPLMLAAAIVLAFAVELLRRQTAREIPAPPPPDLGGSIRRGVGRVRGQTAQEDRLAALERLGRLREQGALTDEEFAAEKARLVSQ